MTDTKFTPGSWRVGRIIAPFDPQPTARYMVDSPGTGLIIADHISDEADANLIATAPDLYAVLEALLETDADISEAGIQTLLAEARAILAKARGEA